MEKRRYTLAAAAAIVATIFSIFGSFLTKVVPPVENQSIVLGLAEFICLVILMWRLRYTETPQKINWRRIFFLVVLMLIIGVSYYAAFSSWVVTVASKSQVRGFELKQEWLDECNGIGISNDCAEYVLKVHGDQAGIENTNFWSKSSILLLEIALLTIYIVLTLLICLAVFTVFDRDAEMEEAARNPTDGAKRNEAEDQGLSGAGQPQV